MRRALTGVLAALALLTACTGGSGGSDGPGGSGGTSGGPGPNEPATLRVLASSELVDMKPVLDEVRKRTGIEVRPTYTGTLDAVDLLARGKADGRYDALWLSSDDYLRLRPEAERKVVSETPVMASPVAIGVRTTALRRLGWSADDVTWADIEKAVTDGKLTYGMTDPARSNSGFATLISVASALSGAQSALTAQDVATATPRLRTFFQGQQLTSGSSGWLAQAYARRSDVDALLNYESVLTGIRGLTVIRPKDGVVTADYPLSGLAASDAATRQDVGRLAAALREPEIQQLITTRTHRRPVVPSVPPAAPLTADRRRELPFPGSRSVADSLVDSYENRLRRPSRTVYVLDTSGSMQGERLKQLKSALTGLTGDFRDRETVTLMPFGSKVKNVSTHVVDPAAPQQGIGAIRADTERLTAGGNTALYHSLVEAYGQLGSGTDTFTSIVVMTDGEATDKASSFSDFYEGLGARQKSIPVFPILFGDGDRNELTHIADLTGGRLFDATKGSLDGAFEEIRGYQ